MLSLDISHEAKLELMRRSLVGEMTARIRKEADGELEVSWDWSAGPQVLKTDL